MVNIPGRNSRIGPGLAGRGPGLPEGPGGLPRALQDPQKGPQGAPEQSVLQGSLWSLFMILTPFLKFAAHYPECYSFLFLAQVLPQQGPREARHRAKGSNQTPEGLAQGLARGVEGPFPKEEEKNNLCFSFLNVLFFN